MNEPIRVHVIGAGGVGSWLAHGLVRQLEFQRPGSALIITDGDRYEKRNAERQSFSRIGNKAEVLAYDIMSTKQFTNTIIIPQPYWVVEGNHGIVPSEDTEENGHTASSKIGINSLVSEGDYVFTVVDNYAARALVFDAVRNYKDIDIFTGGNDDAFETFTYHYSRRNYVDVTDHPAIHHPEYVNPPDRNPGLLSCEERSRLEGGGQLVATNMAVASLLLAKAQYNIFSNTERASIDEVNEGKKHPNVDEHYMDILHGASSVRDRTVVPSEMQQNTPLLTTVGVN